MRIGFDFDNTIVSYDQLFYNVAIEKSLIPAYLSISKLAVRDYLRKTNNESAWTELQGYVYGKRMNDAVAFEGAVEFIKLARSNGVKMVIVSHKTKHPFMGPKFDLHKAARGWVESFLVDGVENLIEPGQVFFELTKEEKLSRINQCDCDFFIDDLPEILLMSEFPKKTGRILFDPENCHDVEGMEINVDSWKGIRTFFETKWKTGS